MIEVHGFALMSNPKPLLNFQALLTHRYSKDDANILYYHLMWFLLTYCLHNVSFSDSFVHPNK